MTPTPAARLRHLTSASAITATAHLTAILLDLVHRSIFQWPPSSSLVAAIGDSDLWLLGHAVAAAWIAIGFLRHHPRTLSGAHIASVAVLVPWSVCGFWWASASIDPVSMLGPALALLLGVQSLVLSRAWDSMGDARRRQEG